jgi:hypothetical protein
MQQIIEKYILDEIEENGGDICLGIIIPHYTSQLYQKPVVYPLYEHHETNYFIREEDFLALIYIVLDLMERHNLGLFQQVDRKAETWEGTIDPISEEEAKSLLLIQDTWGYKIDFPVYYIASNDPTLRY